MLWVNGDSCKNIFKSLIGCIIIKKADKVHIRKSLPTFTKYGTNYLKHLIKFKKMNMKTKRYVSDKFVSKVSFFFNF